MIKKWLNNNAFIIGLLVLTVFAVYSNSLHNEMFWDDDDFILKNAYIKDWQYWPQFFTENLIAGSHMTSNYWRPLLLVVFSGAWHLWQDNVIGWHALSIAGHAGVTIILFFLLNKLFHLKNLSSLRRQGSHSIGDPCLRRDNISRLFSLIVCLIFAVHPVHTEIINYANSFGDQLASFWMLFALWCWIRQRTSARAMWTNHWHYFSMLCYVLALLSKETGVVLPGLILISDFIVSNNNKTFFTRLFNAIKQTAPTLVIAIIYLILRATVLDFKSSFNFYGEANALTENIGVRFFAFWHALQMYAGMIFAPYHLQVERIMAVPMHPWYADVLVGAGIFLSMIGSAIFSWRRAPLITFGVAWFFIAILPMSNLVVPINALVYEHFLYMPLIGVLIMIVWVGLKLVDHLPKIKPFLIIIFAGYLIFFMARTVWRNQDWHTAIGFYTQLSEHAPTYRVLNNLGMELAETGQYTQAITTYQRAINKDPTNEVGYHNLAGTLRDTGNKNEAIQLFAHAIKLNPQFIFSYRALGKILVEEKKYTQARTLFEQAVQYGLTPLEHLKMLAQIAERQRDWPAVKRYIEAGLQLDPQDPLLLQAQQTLKEKNPAPFREGN